MCGEGHGVPLKAEMGDQGRAKPRGWLRTHTAGWGGSGAEVGVPAGRPRHLQGARGLSLALTPPPRVGPSAGLARTRMSLGHSVALVLLLDHQAIVTQHSSDCMAWLVTPSSLNS